MARTTRPDPFLVADDRALDFLNSVGEPWGTRIDWLSDGADLLAWLVQTDLIPTNAVKRLQKQALPEAFDEVAALARDLREWFRGFVVKHAGQRLEPRALADLSKLNRLIARDDVYRQIEPRSAETTGFTQQQTSEATSSSLQWQRHRRWRTPADLLLPIAEAMGDLICQANFERVKNCEGPKCTLWFHDTSKNHTRRWCTMAVCGNRAKAAAHRARTRPSRQG